MMARSHMPFAMACWWTYGLATGYPLTGLDSLVAALGGLLPDIDHPDSVVGRRIRPVSVPLAAIFGHRGFTHSLMAVALLAGIIITMGGSHSGAWLPLCIGYLSHVLGDTLSASGVPLLYPWRRDRFRWRILPVNSRKETLAVGMVFFLVLLTGAGGEIWRNTVASLPLVLKQRLSQLF